MSEDVYAEYRTNLYGMTDLFGTPLHTPGKGTVFHGSIPVGAVTKRFNLETVESRETFYGVPIVGGPNDGGTEYVPIPDSQTLVRVRDGRVQNRSVGAETDRLQYNYLTDLAAGVTGEGRGDLKIVAAGTTRNGGRAYLQIAMDEVQSVAGMDYFPFITFGMSHDGTLGIVSSAGSRALICANMFQALLGGRKVAEKGLRTRQTKRQSAEIHTSRHAIALGLEKQKDEMDKAIKALADTVVSDEVWSAYVQELFPITDATKPAGITRAENNRGRLTELWNTDARVTPWHGSALGALQAANVFDLWERGTRGANGDQVGAAGHRMWDDLLSGSLVKQENTNAEALVKVLASV